MKNCDPAQKEEEKRNTSEPLLCLGGKKLLGRRYTIRVWARIGHGQDARSCEPQLWMDLIFAAEKKKHNGSEA